MSGGLTVTKEIRFEAAHRLLGRDGRTWRFKERCGSLHGHSWRAWATVGL